MSDREEDYMSDKFLADVQDVRPSLVHDRAKKRQIDVENKQKEQIKRQKELKKISSGIVDNDTLQNALSKPIEAENKGFKLLAKMGYKPGEALGKSSNDSSRLGAMEQRLTVPIGITLKTDRQGLGRETALKELNEKRQKIREKRLRKQLDDAPSVEEFRRRSNQKYEEKFILNALRRCQITCENLDLESNVDTPEMCWFWPERNNAKDIDNTKLLETENVANEVDDEEDEFSNSEKLELLTNYIRTSYLFCYWCGIRYKDENDLNDNCPGLTKDDH